MANRLQRLFIKALGLDEALKEMSSNVVAVGSPNQGAASNPQDEGVAGDIGVLTGPAAQKLKFTRKEIPRPDDPDSMVAYIKQWRAQLKVRSVLTELGNALVDGFRLKGSPELEAWASQQRLYAKLQRIAIDLCTIGWCVVYVSEDPKLPPSLTVLHNVALKRDVYGNEIIYLQLSDEARTAVSTNSKFYPSYWTQQLDSSSGINITRIYKNSANNDGMGTTKLTQGGAYFITIEGDGEDLLPLSPIYPFLAMAADAEKISDSVGSFVDAIKYYLLHAKVGDKVGSDARDGRPKPPSKERLTSVLNALSMGFRAGALVTPADVDVSYQVLDKDPLTIPRSAFMHTQADLRKEVGVPDYQDASSEGAAMFMARSFLPSIRFIRHACIVQQFLLPLLADLKAGNRIPGVEKARILWSEDSVHDLGTKLNVAKFKHSTGAYSLQSICEYLDPDYNQEAEFEQKKFEQNNSELIGNIYEISQGQSDKALELAAQQKKQAEQQPKEKPADGKTPAGENTPAPTEDPGGRPPK